MAISVPVSSKPIEITDSTLLHFHNQREVVYQGTKKHLDSTLETLLKSTQDVGTLTENVRTRGKNFQEQTVVPIPTKEQLEHEKDGLLESLKELKSTLPKINLISKNIDATILFLTPIVYSWSEESALKEQTPELYAQAKRSEEICLGYIGDLQKSFCQFKALHEKLVTSLNSTELTWSLQRFCQIVDSEGQPLGLTSRFTNFLLPYVSSSIPAPKSQIPPLEEKAASQ